MSDLTSSSSVTASSSVPVLGTKTESAGKDAVQSSQGGNSTVSEVANGSSQSADSSDKAALAAKEIDSKRKRYIRSNEELDGSTRVRRIYKAYDSDEGVEVAMHIVPASAANGSAALDAGLPDLPLMPDSSLSVDGQHTALIHDHLIRVLDTWREPGGAAGQPAPHLVYVTPIVTAGTLQNYIARIDDVRFRVIRKWCRQMLSALGYLHAHGVSHGDVRLSNIYINGETGNVLVGHFLVGRTVDTEAIRRVLRYAAPETFSLSSASGGKPTPSSDLYAFGMCVLEMVTRALPYGTYGDSKEEVLRLESDKQAGVLPPEFEEIESRVGVGVGEERRGPKDTDAVREDVRAVKDLIGKCLARRPEDRPAVSVLLAEHEFLRERKEEKDDRERKTVAATVASASGNSATAAPSPIATPAAAASAGPQLAVSANSAQMPASGAGAVHVGTPVVGSAAVNAEQRKAGPAHTDTPTGAPHAEPAQAAVGAAVPALVTSTAGGDVPRSVNTSPQKGAAAAAHHQGSEPAAATENATPQQSYASVAASGGAGSTSAPSTARQGVTSIPGQEGAAAQPRPTHKYVVTTSTIPITGQGVAETQVVSAAPSSVATPSVSTPAAQATTQLALPPVGSSSSLLSGATGTPFVAAPTQAAAQSSSAQAQSVAVPAASANAPAPAPTPAAAQTGPRLLGLSLQGIKFGRSSLGVTLALYYRSNAKKGSTGDPPICYRLVRFLAERSWDMKEAGRKLACEMVAYNLCHPDDVDNVSGWLVSSLGVLLVSPHVFDGDALKAVPQPARVAGPGGVMEKGSAEKEGAHSGAGSSSSRRRTDSGAVSGAGRRSSRSRARARTGSTSEGGYLGHDHEAEEDEEHEDDDEGIEEEGEEEESSEMGTTMDASDARSAGARSAGALSHITGAASTIGRSATQSSTRGGAGGKAYRRLPDRGDMAEHSQAHAEEGHHAHTPATASGTGTGSGSRMRTGSAMSSHLLTTSSAAAAAGGGHDRRPTAGSEATALSIGHVLSEPELAGSHGGGGNGVPHFIGLGLSAQQGGGSAGQGQGGEGTAASPPAVGLPLSPVRTVTPSVIAPGFGITASTAVAGAGHAATAPAASNGSSLGALASSGGGATTTSGATAVTAVRPTASVPTPVAGHTSSAPPVPAPASVAASGGGSSAVHATSRLAGPAITAATGASGRSSFAPGSSRGGGSREPSRERDSKHDARAESTAHTHAAVSTARAGATTPSLPSIGIPASSQGTGAASVATPAASVLAGNLSVDDLFHQLKG